MNKADLVWTTATDHGIGRFKVKHSPARDGRNPRTGEKITIKASKRLTFQLAQAVKDKIAG